MMENDRLMTEREAAKQIGYSVYSLRDFRKRGLIEYFRFNNRTIKYSASQLESFKRRHMQVRHA
jgi:predicted site-specific integrase-resolvase